MNLRISLSAIILVAVIAVAATWVFENRPGEGESGPDLPFFYTLEPDDIRHINIVTPDGETDFNLKPDERVWYFDEPAGIPVSQDRFGGMTFLLAGPQIKRILQDSVEDPSLFGLDDPDLVVDLTLRDESSVAMELGDITPDGESQYARLIGFPQMVLVDSSWGGVISGLVSEPPMPEWIYEMDPSNVREVLFFEGNDVVRGIAFNEGLGWVECDIPVPENVVPCTGTTPVDFSGVEKHLQYIADHQYIGVAQVARTPDQASPELFGITDVSPYFDILLEIEQRPGVTERRHITMAFGDVSPDGAGMYVRAMERADIATVNADWGRQVLTFFDDRSFVDK